MRSFLAVAESGGFTAAAGRHGISQPTLTRQVRELEERYGVSLFDRSSRHVRLTAAGERLFDHARRAFDELDRADRYLRACARPQLRLYTVRSERLSAFIEILSRLVPTTEISVTMMPSQLVYEGLTQGLCDFGLLTLPDGATDVDVIEIGTYPLLAYVSETHAWRDAQVISLADLDGRAVVIGSTQTQTRRTFDREVRRLGIEMPIVEVNDFEVVLAMAEAGRGIGILGATGQADPREAKALRFAEAGMSQHLHLAAPLANRRQPITDRIFGFARDAMAMPAQS